MTDSSQMKNKTKSIGFLGIVMILLIGLGMKHNIHRENKSIAKPMNEGEKNMRIIVASDLHYLASELTDHGAYFEKLIHASDGKLMDYSEELIDAFIGQVKKEQPDAVILSGDLTFNGEKLSHYSLAEKLETLVESGISVYVLPGNHDLNYPYAASFHGDGYELVESMNENEFAVCYQNMGYASAISRDETSLSYTTDLDQSIRMLFLDVNGNGQPGLITKKTLRWAEKELKKAKQENKKVLAVSHQNLLVHNSLFADGYVMGNAEKLRKLYKKYDVLCNLSGHMHIQHIVESPDQVPEILTSALSITPMHYGIVELEKGKLHYQACSLDVESWAKNQGRTEEELVHFSDYAKNFFWNSTYSQTFDTVKQEEMASFMADLNLAYFTGQMDTMQWNQNIAQKWKEKGDFWSVYILSLEKEERKNQCEFIKTE